MKMVGTIARTMLVPWYIDIPERLTIYRPFSVENAPDQWDRTILDYGESYGFYGGHVILAICEFMEDA